MRKLIIWLVLAQLLVLNIDAIVANSAGAAHESFLDRLGRGSVELVAPISTPNNVIDNNKQAYPRDNIVTKDDKIDSLPIIPEEEPIITEPEVEQPSGIGGGSPLIIKGGGGGAPGTNYFYDDGQDDDEINTTINDTVTNQSNNQSDNQSDNNTNDDNQNNDNNNNNNNNNQDNNQSDNQSNNNAPETFTFSFTPTEIDDVFTNPGIGITTFGNFNEDTSNYPESSLAYFRWYWKDIHPAENSIDFNKIDQVFTDAAANNQKVAFRIMAGNGGQKIPQWLVDKGVQGTWDNGKYMPDFEDPILKQETQELLQSLASRYQNNPGLDHIDVGFIGHWGEWHFSFINNYQEPSQATKNQYIDYVMDAFPNNKVLMQINDVEGMEYAISKGAGWRGDCLGDIYNDHWSHMENMYPSHVAEANAEDAWETAPVVFESCDTVQQWVNDGKDIQEIFDWALDYHTSVLNLKSDPIPNSATTELDNFLRKIGYRFVIDNLEAGSTLQSNDNITVNLTLSNVGVAPPYDDFEFKLRLKDGVDNILAEYDLNIDVKSLLPGTHQFQFIFNLPNNMLDITYIDIGLFDNQDSMNLAIEGKTADGWYELGILA